MMKILGLSLLSFLITLQISAQITITNNDMPVAGDTFRVSVTANMQGYDPSATGPGYSWNFDTLKANLQRVDTFLDISNTPTVYNFMFFAASYGQVGPTPNNGNNFVTFEDMYSFFDNSSSSYTQMGFGAKVNGNPIPVKYSSYDRFYKFPMNYNDTDSSFAEYGFQVPNYGYYGQEIVRKDTVDGYGTLQTPFGSFQTLRVKSTVYREDTIYYDSLMFGTTITRPVEIEYKWLAANEGIPVLSVTERTGTYNIVYRDSMRPGVYQVGLEETAFAQASMEVYPNPSQGVVFVELTSSERGTHLLQLYSLSGKTVLRRSLNFSGTGLKKIKLSLTESPAGMYLLKVLTPSGKVMNRKLQLINSSVH